MTDHDPLDDFDDPALAAALGALAPTPDGDPYPAAHAHFVRRRRRHRAAAAGSTLVGAAAVVVIAVVLGGGGGSGISGVRTVPAHRGSSTSLPGTPSSTTHATAPTTTTTSPSRGAVGPNATTTTTRPSTPTTAAAPHDETVDSAGGSVRVRISGTTVTLLGNTPAPGYVADVRASGPSEVEVRFRTGSSGSTEHRIRLRFDSNGTLQREIT